MVDHDSVDMARQRIETGVRLLDGPAVRDVLLESFLLRGVDVTAAKVITPVLRALAAEGHADGLTPEHELFVAGVIRTALAELRVPLLRPTGTVVLACLPGVRQDLALDVLAAVLDAHWFRTVLLGADTPLAAAGSAALEVGAGAVVLDAGTTAGAAPDLRGVEDLARSVPVFLLGDGNALDGASTVAALPTDPMAAGARIAEFLTPSPQPERPDDESLLAG